MTGDVRGIAVHAAARVMALAGPGEVLVSGTTRELLEGSGLAFEDRGSHELKGISGRAPGLRPRSSEAGRASGPSAAGLNTISQIRTRAR